MARVQSGTHGEESRPSTVPSRFVSTSIHFKPEPPALELSSPVRFPSTQLESAGQIVPPSDPLVARSTSVVRAQGAGTADRSNLR
jgi:hypothetical protein